MKKFLSLFLCLIWSLECDLLHTSLNYIVRSILPEQP